MFYVHRINLHSLIYVYDAAGALFNTKFLIVLYLLRCDIAQNNFFLAKVNAPFKNIYLYVH